MKLLALETSTEHLSVAACAGTRQAVREVAGGAQASFTLLPAIEAVLGERASQRGALPDRAEMESAVRAYLRSFQPDEHRALLALARVVHPLADRLRAQIGPRARLEQAREELLKKERK